MKTFNEIINKRLKQIGAPAKAQKLRKLCEEFGLTLIKLTEDEIFFSVPENPFDIEGKVEIRAGKRYCYCELDYKYVTKPYCSSYSFSCYEAESIFDEIVKRIEDLVNKAS